MDLLNATKSQYAAQFKQYYKDGQTPALLLVNTFDHGLTIPPYITEVLIKNFDMNILDNYKTVILGPQEFTTAEKLLEEGKIIKGILREFNKRNSSHE